jgi:hypothetical protein
MFPYICLYADGLVYIAFVSVSDVPLQDLLNSSFVHGFNFAYLFVNFGFDLKYLIIDEVEVCMLELFEFRNKTANVLID